MTSKSIKLACSFGFALLIALVLLVVLTYLKDPMAWTATAFGLATFEWVDWFNNRRLLAPISYVPPVECEEQYYRSRAAPAMLAGVT